VQGVLKTKKNHLKEFIKKHTEEPKINILQRQTSEESDDESDNEKSPPQASSRPGPSALYSLPKKLKLKHSSQALFEAPQALPEAPQASSRPRPSGLCSLPKKLKVQHSSPLRYRTEGLLTHAKKMTHQDKRLFKITKTRFAVHYKDITGLLANFERWLVFGNGKTQRLAGQTVSNLKDVWKTIDTKFSLYPNEIRFTAAE